MQSQLSNAQDYWFILHEDTILLNRQADSYSLLQTEAVKTLAPYFSHTHALGIFNNHSCFCADLQAPEISGNYEFVNLRKALAVLGKQWYKATTKAFSVLNWDRNHQYCGRCGALTEHKLPMFERLCTQCHLAFYPRISPSVIVLIQRDNQILMARSPHFTPGAYGLIAGFVEIGESLEDAVHREVKEEVSLEIKNLRYFDSQPWPFPDSLMVGFFADYANGEIIIDKTEIEAAGWYTYENMPGRPSSPVGIARRMVDYFVSQQEALHK